MSEVRAGSGRSDTARALDTAPSIQNPLRSLGIARLVAGVWFIASGVGTLRHYDYLLAQIGRLLKGVLGATDAPIRSLLAVPTGALLVLLGLRLLIDGFRWTQRVRLPAGGPAEVAPDDVVAALREHRLPPYAMKPTEVTFPFRSWLSDDFAGMTRWRRELIGGGARIAVRACIVACVVSVLCLVVDRLSPSSVFGPFPTSFVVVLPLVSVAWVIVALIVIPTERLRAESMALPLTVPADAIRGDVDVRILETRPRLLEHAGGMTTLLGLGGVAVQCLTPVWWTLSHIGYPLLTTSIIRHTGAIAGGVLFFLLGRWMVNAASELSQFFRYDSIVVVIDGVGDEMVAPAAAVRTEGRSVTSPRRVIAAVAAAYVREPALAMLAVEERAYNSKDDRRWRRPGVADKLADPSE